MRPFLVLIDMGLIAAPYICMITQKLVSVIYGRVKI